MSGTTHGTLLAVDDDRNLLKIIAMRLETLGYAVTAARTGQEARDLLSRQTFDLAVIDLHLKEQDGITLMEELHQLSPDMPVIILTAFGSIESAVDAMRRGAATYLTKPFDARELALHVERALESRRLTSEIRRLKGLLAERHDAVHIVARSEPMRRVLEVVSQIARNDSTVYIHGESGTGKEVMARAIHLASARAEEPFVAINCAALPETLLESELFGHEKGAFTGAVKSSKGLFAQAHGGTILLDEIGDMPLSIQAKFLRVLQERQFYPVGGERPLAVDVRVIVATNRNLEELVREGLFREDLYYRVNVIPITLPPLRERREDIPLLAEAFLTKYSRRMKKRIKGFSPAAVQRLMLHDWPGNVRELENAIEYAVAMTLQEVITEGHILPAKSVGIAETPKPLKQARDEFEAGYLVRLLELTGGNISNAAALAGKYRADLYNLLKKHGINPGDFKK
ncbi:sigma-54-dependent transcriptional regulator [Trichlorobacter ammonificans]|uniref:DNA-binding transcriptional activator GlrR n=1 Tax=Trichlorobacter ammonificans TaxID=2916410 RepID=A0ABN8HFT5_9BACT|nr:sigma-54 dependent transcriptional regulator [Trichlorobacter ammonificans]CAH2030820.1 DNA-binding transcriptional activator GlrR [Trichlorobacter ammonificans]